MPIRTGLELGDAERCDSACRPEPPAAPSPANALTAAARGSVTQPRPTSPRRSCGDAKQPAHALVEVAPNGDDGRRLRRLTLTWFGACILALSTLWYGIADDAQSSELHPVSDHDRGSQVALLDSASG